MSFFDAPEALPPPEPEARVPSWLGPPANVLGAPIGLSHLLARTEAVVIALSHGVAYPSGFELTVTAIYRPGQFELGPGTFLGGPRDGGEDGFLLGVEFADGRKGSTQGAVLGRTEAGTPDGPVLVPRGGGGDGHRMKMDYWVWPLPPPGQLAFVCRWNDQGVTEARIDVAAAPILAAALQAETLWDEESPPGPGAASMSF